MKRNIVIAATVASCLCFNLASAQQTQQQIPSTQPGGPGTSGAPDASGMPGTSGQSGAAGGAAGQAAAPDTSGAPAGGATSGASGKSAGPVAGRSALGVSAVEMETIILGWSARKELLGKSVVNDNKERIGEIEDVIVTPNDAVSYAIIGVGGFLGMGERRVAIPFHQVKLRDTTLLLPGATKDTLKGLPEFKYAPRK